jgi:NAD(P)-dependent dehydrogenase (short-subunit alcohol dehydrogenase family)
MPSVLITGANRGLGLEFCRQYAAAGWQVFATCRDAEGARAGALGRLAAEHQDRFEIQALDVADGASVAAAAATHGDRPLDLLLNNAGVVGDRASRLGAMDYQAWQRCLEINVLGPMRVAEAFTDAVAAGQQKLIVTISSGMGSLSETYGGQVIYRTSKAALNMVVRDLAFELKDRAITCVAMHPGWVSTDMGGAGATLTPEQSVSALSRTIAGLGPGQSGRFLNYDGQERAW